MKLFKTIWQKKSNEKNLLSTSFPSCVKEIIKKIDEVNSEINDDEFYGIISQKAINEFESNEIYIFLPIAFAQLWIKTANWNEEYNEILPNKKEVSKRYDETLSFQIIIEIVKEYFENKPSKNTIIQIGGRSAEINAINKLLLDGGKVEDVKVTKTTIIR
ncbi:hypothetical protein G3O08_17495 [Cryomorpha ignava]|uniref:Uncharacterized protein n=1 Tax=Cryomorpha ignava TaxID=101383 RepID=A0A7K3WUW0_9FLAO|nr:hypothetical protein [Cryomorpha ignava]NEN25294.1 hypothetical protein [Cryomorpha ignava]